MKRKPTRYTIRRQKNNLWTLLVGRSVWGRNYSNLRRARDERDLLQFYETVNKTYEPRKSRTS